MPHSWFLALNELMVDFVAGIGARPDGASLTRYPHLEVNFHVLPFQANRVQPTHYPSHGLNAHMGQWPSWTMCATSTGFSRPMSWRRSSGCAGLGLGGNGNLNELVAI